MTRRSPFVDPAQASLFGETADTLFGHTGEGAGEPAVSPRAASTDDAVAPHEPEAESALPPVQAQRGAGPNPTANDEFRIRPPDPAPTPTLHSMLTPAEFRHPQADREIRLGEHLVGYALKRVRRRSIGFIVGVEGLSVNAPRWVGVREVEAALREKGDWVLRKLHEQQERSRRLLAAKVDWRDGTSIPFLGETVIVVLDPRAGAVPGGALLNSDATGLPGVPRLTLHVGLGQSASAAQIRDAVQSWLQRQARRVFEERCRLYAERLGVRWTRLALSSAQTRWGSANASGAIRLNWRLIHFALPTIDYVVAHELAHLREMNHSPRFWDVVRSVLPDYERARGELRSDSLPQFD